MLVLSCIAFVTTAVIGVATHKNYPFASGLFVADSIVWFTNALSAP